LPAKYWGKRKNGIITYSISSSGSDETAAGHQITGQDQVEWRQGKHQTAATNARGRCRTQENHRAEHRIVGNAQTQCGRSR